MPNAKSIRPDALAALAVGFLWAFSAHPALAATAPVAQTPYAQQILQGLDSYVAAVSAQLEKASSLDPQVFASQQPAVMGPAGEWLPIVKAQRRDRAGGTGSFVRVRGDQLVVGMANQGAQPVAVAVPLSEIGARLPDFAQPAGAAIFDLQGHLLAGTSPSSEVASMFVKDLPQAQGSLQLSDDSQTSSPPGALTTFEVARSDADGLVVVTRMPPDGSPEPTLQGALLPAPEARPVAIPAPGRPWPRHIPRRLIVPGALGLSGVLLGIIVLTGRRGRKIDPPAMRGVDYLDALAEAPELKRRRRRPRPKPEEVDPETSGEGQSQDGADRSLEAPHFETSFEVAAMASDPEPRISRAPEPDREPALEPAASEVEGPSEAPVPAPKSRKAKGLALFWNKEETPEPPQVEEAEPVEFARLVEADPSADPEVAEQERTRHIDAFRQEREAIRAVRAATPPSVRPAEPRLEDSMRKTVRPQDVLVTKGEVQTLVDKETERIVSRMTAVMEDAEARKDAAMGTLRETFGEVLAQFETLQDDRKRDLAAIYDLKHEIENELASSTLKIKQSEAKATEGLVRLSDRVEDLARKVEGWISDQRMADERLSGALSALRSGWESQADAQGELRRTLRDALDDSQATMRRLENALDREATERKGEIERLSHDIRMKIAQDDQVAKLSGQLEELQTTQELLHRRIDRSETQQQQALDALGRKTDVTEALSDIRRQLGTELEILKSRIERGDAGLSDLKSAVDRLQGAQQDEQTVLLDQLYVEIDKAKSEATSGQAASQSQIEALKEENVRLQQRQQQIIQLMQNLHGALSKSDARTAEEVERLKAQNTELQQMLLHLVKGVRPAAGPPPAPQPVATPAPTPPPPRPAAPRPPAATRPEPAPAAGAEAKPIDLWGRLTGRSGEEDTQRRRRPS